MVIGSSVCCNAESESRILGVATSCRRDLAARVASMNEALAFVAVRADGRRVEPTGRNTVAMEQLHGIVPALVPKVRIAAEAALPEARNAGNSSRSL
jgi:hypothetical protein